MRAEMVPMGTSASKTGMVRAVSRSDGAVCAIAGGPTKAATAMATPYRHPPRCRRLGRTMMCQRRRGGSGHRAIEGNEECGSLSGEHEADSHGILEMLLVPVAAATERERMFGHPPEARAVVLDVELETMRAGGIGGRPNRHDPEIGAGFGRGDVNGDAEPVAHP